MTRFVALALVTVSAGLGCQAMNTPIYFNGTSVLTTMGGNGMERVGPDILALRFRNPSASEQKDLDARRAAAAPVKVPWIARDNVHLELAVTVTNLDTQMGVFNVMVDGANEFIKYDENVVAMALQQGNNDAPTYIPLMEQHLQMLGPGQTFQGLFREDDFIEAENDLNDIDQFMAPFAAVLINRSDVNPIGLEMVPPNVVVPAMIEMDVTFTADVKMQCQYQLRVRDDQDQLLHQTGDTKFNPTPVVFQPMLPPPMTQ
jgi:hypothetical protein